MKWRWDRKVQKNKIEMVIGIAAKCTAKSTRTSRDKNIAIHKVSNRESPRLE